MGGATTGNGRVVQQSRDRFCHRDVLDVSVAGIRILIVLTTNDYLVHCPVWNRWRNLWTRVHGFAPDFVQHVRNGDSIGRGGQRLDRVGRFHQPMHSKGNASERGFDDRWFQTSSSRIPYQCDDCGRASTDANRKVVSSPSVDSHGD